MERLGDSRHLQPIPIASVFAYLALRAADSRPRRHLERVADVVILLGLAVMVAVGGLLAYEII